MTHVTNVDFQFFDGAASGERVSTATFHSGFIVFWMDVAFHDSDSSPLGAICQLNLEKQLRIRHSINAVAGQQERENYFVPPKRTGVYDRVRRVEWVFLPDRGWIAKEAVVNLIFFKNFAQKAWNIYFLKSPTGVVKLVCD